MTISAQQAYVQAGDGESVIGWKLDHDQRTELLKRFPPKFARPIADHVTLRGGSSDNAQLPVETEARVVGRVDDGKGVEALVVELGGTTDRPDGRTYHVTWSLGPGREASESNDLLAAGEWERFDLPMPIRLEPARFPPS